MLRRVIRDFFVAEKCTIFFVIYFRNSGQNISALLELDDASKNLKVGSTYKNFTLLDKSVGFSHIYKIDAWDFAYFSTCVKIFAKQKRYRHLKINKELSMQSIQNFSSNKPHNRIFFTHINERLSVYFDKSKKYTVGVKFFKKMTNTEIISCSQNFSKSEFDQAVTYILTTLEKKPETLASVYLNQLEYPKFIKSYFDGVLWSKSEKNHTRRVTVWKKV